MEDVENALYSFGMSSKQPRIRVIPNLNLSPDGWEIESVHPNSSKVKPWKCSKGHQFNQRVSTVRAGIGCRVCSNRVLAPGINDLATVHPELAAQALDWDPETITASYSKMKSWRCIKGHSWEAAPNKRWSSVTNRPTPCPECLHKGTLRKNRGLREANDAIASEAYGWDPGDYGERSAKVLPWMCPEGHTFETSIAKRMRGDGCPYCSGHQVLTGLNDLRTKFPDIARESHGWDPDLVTPGSHERKTWVCKFGHTWSQKIYVRVINGTGCPVCSNLVILPGINDLQTLFSEIADQAYGWDPSKIGAGSSKVLKWKCKRGHITEKTPSSKVQSKDSEFQGCGYCAGRIIELGVSDLRSTYSELVLEVFEWDPTEFLSGSTARKTWKCLLGHKYERSIRDRVAGQACPYCSNHRLLVGFNDLATTNPTLAGEAYGWDPSTVFSSGKKRLNWKCQEGHIWELPANGRINHRTGLISGCPYCTNQKVFVGFNDFASLQPELSKQLISCDPKTLVEKSNKVVTWRDEIGHEWKTSPANRVKGIGCPTCAKYGFSPEMDAYIYLLHHESWELFKIGISNSLEERTNLHKRRGWVVLDIRGPMDGILAFKWEQSILKMLKNRGAELGPTDIAGKFDGYTESWLVGSFPVEAINELMELVRGDEA